MNIAAITLLAGLRERYATTLAIGADLATALTLADVPEAIGVVQAARAAGLPALTVLGHRPPPRRRSLGHRRLGNHVLGRAAGRARDLLIQPDPGEQAGTARVGQQFHGRPVPRQRKPSRRPKTAAPQLISISRPAGSMARSRQARSA